MSASFAGWNPTLQTTDGSFGVQNNQLDSTSTGRAARRSWWNLTNPIWSPVCTNTLVGNTSYFSDPHWTNYPNRFYRVRSP